MLIEVLCDRGGRSFLDKVYLYRLSRTGTSWGRAREARVRRTGRTGGRERTGRVSLNNGRRPGDFRCRGESKMLLLVYLRRRDFVVAKRNCRDCKKARRPRLNKGRPWQSRSHDHTLPPLSSSRFQSPATTLWSRPILWPSPRQYGPLPYRLSQSLPEEHLTPISNALPGKIWHCPYAKPDPSNNLIYSRAFALACDCSESVRSRG
jgi:hypothetical protein